MLCTHLEWRSDGPQKFQSEWQPGKTGNLALGGRCGLARDCKSRPKGKGVRLPPSAPIETSVEPGQPGQGEVGAEHELALPRLVPRKHGWVAANSQEVCPG